MPTPLDPGALARRDEIDVALREIAGTLDALSPEQAPGVEHLRPIVRKETARLHERLQNLRGSARQQWAQLADIATKSDRLAEEALAFVGGLQARSLGLDGRCCDLADQLIQSIGSDLVAPYSAAITLPAASEYMDVLSAVIRVRYPSRGVWDLPIALHEFGHYLAAATGTWTLSPHAVIAREREKSRSEGAHAEELWADAFATYVAGPAYAAAALSRLNPVRADVDASTHPSATKRSLVMFNTLNHLQASWKRSGRAGGSLEPAVSLVEQLWGERRTAAGVTDVSQDAQSVVTSLTDEFLDILDEEVVGNRYANSTGARTVVKWLLKEGPQPVDPLLIDILNGGWWARRRVESDGRPDLLSDISPAIDELCETILTSRGS
jgi:hypothetical protein